MRRCDIATRAKRPTDRTIGVERTVSVGPDREGKGGAVVKLRDERGAMLALRVRPGQVQTLANGPAGIVAAGSAQPRCEAPCPG